MLEGNNPDNEKPLSTVESARKIFFNIFPEFKNSTAPLEEKGFTEIFFHKDFDAKDRAKTWKVVLSPSKVYLSFGQVKKGETEIDTSCFDKGSYTIVPPIDPETPVEFFNIGWEFGEETPSATLEKALEYARGVYDEKWEGTIVGFEIFNFKDRNHPKDTPFEQHAVIQLKDGQIITKVKISNWYLGDRLAKKRGEVKIRKPRNQPNNPL